MSILVIGSTGTIGTQVVEEIARRGVEVHALVHEAQAKRDDNVIPVEGDTTDMDSMRKAMSGMTTLFLLNPVVVDELSRALLMLDLAQEAGMQRVVYFSMFNADTFLDCPHACAKYATELMIEKFGIPTTILRPNYFFQNDAAAAKTHEMPMPIGSLGTSMADARDIAEVAAIELIRRDRSPVPLPTEIIEIHGPDVITAESAARTWTEVLGKEVTYPGDDLRAFESKFEKMASKFARLRRRRDIPWVPARRHGRAGRCIRADRDDAWATFADLQGFRGGDGGSCLSAPTVSDATRPTDWRKLAD